MPVFPSLLYSCSNLWHVNPIPYQVAHIPRHTHSYHPSSCPPFTPRAALAHFSISSWDQPCTHSNLAVSDEHFPRNAQKQQGLCISSAGPPLPRKRKVSMDSARGLTRETINWVDAKSPPNSSLTPASLPPSIHSSQALLAHRASRHCHTATLPHGTGAKCLTPLPQPHCRPYLAAAACPALPEAAPPAGGCCHQPG